MGAVLTPRLGQGLELHVGGVTLLGAEPVLDGQQFFRVKRQAALNVELFECAAVQRSHVDHFDAGTCFHGAVGIYETGLDRVQRPLLHHGIGQQAIAQILELGLRWPVAVDVK